jgi:hypothetical protein
MCNVLECKNRANCIKRNATGGPAMAWSIFLFLCPVYLNMIKPAFRTLIDWDANVDAVVVAMTEDAVADIMLGRGEFKGRGLDGFWLGRERELFIALALPIDRLFELALVLALTTLLDLGLGRAWEMKGEHVFCRMWTVWGFM